MDGCSYKVEYSTSSSWLAMQLNRTTYGECPRAQACDSRSLIKRGLTIRNSHWGCMMLIEDYWLGRLRRMEGRREPSSLLPPLIEYGVLGSITLVGDQKATSFIISSHIDKAPATAPLKALFHLRPLFSCITCYETSLPLHHLSSKQS